MSGGQPQPPLGTSLKGTPFSEETIQMVPLEWYIEAALLLAYGPPDHL